MLTALVTTPPVSAAVTCSAVTTPARSWASAVEAPRCRRDDHVVALEDRVLGERLGREDVERGARQPCPTRGPASSASRSISSPRAQLTIRTPSRIFPIASASMKFDRLRRLRQVQRDEVGARVELVRVVDALDAELAEALGGDELVEGDRRRISKAWARAATSWPMRPKPSTPSVLP